MLNLEFKTDEEIHSEQSLRVAASILGVDPEYLKALEKLMTVCMKQNPYLN